MNSSTNLHIALTSVWKKQIFQKHILTTPNRWINSPFDSTLKVHNVIYKIWTLNSISHSLQIKYAHYTPTLGHIWDSLQTLIISKNSLQQSIHNLPSLIDDTFMQCNGYDDESIDHMILNLDENILIRMGKVE